MAKIDPANPHCFECRRQMIAGTKGYWECVGCHYFIPIDRRQRARRYIIRRDVEKIAASLAANAMVCCLMCKKAMWKKGPSWHCYGCRRSTRIRFKSRRRGPSPLIDPNPECFECQARMRSHGDKWRCILCGATPLKRRSRFRENRRDREIGRLIKIGVSSRRIMMKVKCDSRTVANVRRQLAGRPRRAQVRVARPMFEDLSLRVSRALPWGLPVEARDDIQQEILLDAIKAIDELIVNVPRYIKRYWQADDRRRFISLDDADNKIAKTLVG